MRTTAWRAEWSDGEALLIMAMEEEKLWVRIVSIDTPSSSHHSALVETQICVAPTMSPAPPSATTNYDSCGGVAGEREQQRNHHKQLLALHNRVDSEEGQDGAWTAKAKCSWKSARSRIGGAHERQFAFCLEVGRPPHLAARAHCHPNALPPGLEGVTPLPSCGPRAAPPSAAASRHCPAANRRLGSLSLMTGSPIKN